MMQLKKRFNYIMFNEQNRHISSTLSEMKDKNPTFTCQIHTLIELKFGIYTVHENKTKHVMPFWTGLTCRRLYISASD